MTFDYAIHSAFLIHWTGKDIDDKYDKSWREPHKGKSETSEDCTSAYIHRLRNILKYGLWMTEEKKSDLAFDKDNYRTLNVKNKSQKDSSNLIFEEIKRIKGIKDRGNRVERGNWPIEIDLDACKNFKRLSP